MHYINFTSFFKANLSWNRKLLNFIHFFGIISRVKKGFYYAKILGSMRKAIEEFHMIDEGDKIAVALSGGKDSITLLMALKTCKDFIPRNLT